MNEDVVFCPCCGAKTVKKKDGLKKRDFCRTCRKFFYNNPLVAVAAVCFIGDGIVFVKRRFNPCRGMWTLPGGFIEMGETIENAVKRELKEETGLIAKKIEFLKAMTVKTDFWKTIVLMGFNTVVSGAELKPGDDAESVKIIDTKKIPLVTFSAHKILIREALKRRKEK